MFSEVLWIRCKMQAYSHMKNKNIEQNPRLQVLLGSAVTLTSLSLALQQNSQGTDATASCICREGEIQPQAEGSGYHTSLKSSKDTPDYTQKSKMNCTPRQQCINTKILTYPAYSSKGTPKPHELRKQLSFLARCSLRIRTWWQI